MKREAAVAAGGVQGDLRGNEKDNSMTINVGDTVTWRRAGSPSESLDPIGVAGCTVVKLGESEDGEPAALIAVLGGGTCGALLADLHKDKP
jgi:hypothetical protein